MRRLALLLAVLFVLLAPRVSQACPSCQEAVPASSGDGEEDQARLAHAYNNSIYLMVGMPYFLLGTVGFLVYRHLRGGPTGQASVPGAAHSLPPDQEVRSSSTGDRACSLPSRGDDS